MADEIRVTALHPAHKNLNAQMIQFAGWEMPGRYGSTLQEHHAVRTNAGMFDVSHMGRLYVGGGDAEGLLDRALTTDVCSLQGSRARYCMACQEDGGIIDDLIVYHLRPESYLVVCNAANRGVILVTLRESVHTMSDIVIDDRTTGTAMVALQGPRALAILGTLSDFTPESLPPFNCGYKNVLSRKMLVVRTGYTGEDGVELIMDAEAALELWQAFLDAGVTPCGLGARDSLRLEAALRLWGNEMDTTVNPFEAGLGRFVDLNKQEFTGKVALCRVKAEGVQKRLVGFEMVDRGIPRHDFPILEDGATIGRVTSGGYSPTLDKNIGLGYVPTSKTGKDVPLTIDIRGRQVQARVVSLPFYRRSSLK